MSIGLTKLDTQDDDHFIILKEQIDTDGKSKAYLARRLKMKQKLPGKESPITIKKMNVYGLLPEKGKQCK